MLSDEDNVAFRQVVDPFAGLKRIGVHQAAVVSSPLGIRTLIIALNLDIVLLSLTINSVNIQPCRTSLEVFQFKLGNYPNHRQVIAPENYSEQQLRTFLVFKNLSHECIVHKTKVMNDLKEFHSALRGNVVVFYFVHRNHRPFLEL